MYTLAAVLSTKGVGCPDTARLLATLHLHRGVRALLVQADTDPAERLWQAAGMVKKEDRRHPLVLVVDVQGDVIQQVLFQEMEPDADKLREACTLVGGQPFDLGSQYPVWLVEASGMPDSAPQV